MTDIIRGKLCYATNGEEDELVGLLDETHHVRILAEELPKTYGEKVITVRYVVSEKFIASEDITEKIITLITGVGDIDYGMHYSELTGYLWTDEDFKVGGHDMIAILRGHIGKYLHLEIRQGKK